MFTANLKGNQEFIFRQSSIGSVGHIVNNHDLFMDLINDESDIEIRIDTLCGRNLKYNTVYSSMDGRAGVVRNACEYCFTEYEPNERSDRSGDSGHGGTGEQIGKRSPKRNSKADNLDLPF